MRLYLLQYGLSHEGTPVPGYLIVTDDQQRILVDTGFPASDVGKEPIGGFIIKPEDHVVAQLARLGLTPDDIDLVVCSHFDIDHAGANDLFPQAEFIVQRQHDAFARSGETDRFEVTRPSWDAPGLRYRLIDGDTVIAPGVELIDTSGHVPGHQSVLVRLPETGPVLITVDALHRDPAIPFEPSAVDMDPAGTAASIERIKAVIAQAGVVLTLFGHNSAQWATVRKAPDYYT